MKQKIFPAIIAKNQKELNESFQRWENSVKELHLDVIDGKFVPNLSLNFALHLSKKFVYNAHLMMKNPETWIKKHLKQKEIKLFIPQFEEIKDKEKYLAWMKQHHQKIAFTLKPETQVKEIAPYLKKVDHILILTVNPGFYGSPFLPENLKKIKQIKTLNPKIKIIVDGAMNPTTIKQAAQAGADYFGVGSYLAKADHPKERMKSLMNLF